MPAGLDQQALPDITFDDSFSFNSTFDFPYGPAPTYAQASFIPPDVDPNFKHLLETFPSSNHAAQGQGWNDAGLTAPNAALEFFLGGAAPSNHHSVHGG